MDRTLNYISATGPSRALFKQRQAGYRQNVVVTENRTPGQGKCGAHCPNPEHVTESCRICISRNQNACDKCPLNSCGDCPDNAWQDRQK